MLGGCKLKPCRPMLLASQPGVACWPQAAHAFGRYPNSSLSIRSKSGAAPAALPARSANSRTAPIESSLHVRWVTQPHKRWNEISSFFGTECPHVSIHMQARKWTGHRSVLDMQRALSGVRLAPTCSTFTTTTTACRQPCCSCMDMSESGNMQLHWLLS
jgi:hypothetical protein